MLLVAPEVEKSVILTNEKTISMVLFLLVIRAKKSTRKFAQERGVTHRSIQRMLKVCHFHPNMRHLVQKL